MSSGWIWDPRRRVHYYYNHAIDSLVDENRVVAPRPAEVPPASYYALATQQHAAQAQSTGAAVPHDRQRSQPSATPSLSPQDPVSALHADVETLRIGSSTAPNRQRTVHTAPVQTQISPQNPPQVPPQVHRDTNGEYFVSAHNPNIGVRTTYSTQPPELTTDPELLRRGVQANKKVYATEPDVERLFPSYRLHRSSFFVVGRVFLVLWVEPAGEDTTIVTSVEQSDQNPGRRGPDAGFSVGRFNEPIYSKVRRFVVIRCGPEGSRYCSALPIVTYGKQGVGKPGTVKSEHAIIYTGKQAPQPLQTELPRRGEPPMRQQAIRVTPDEATDRLDALSRIDFGKVHTIQHNLKVKNFGKVHEKSLAALQAQFRNVWKESHSTADSAVVVDSSSTGNRNSGAVQPVRRLTQSSEGGRQSTRSLTGDDTARTTARSGGRDNTQGNDEGTSRIAAERVHAAKQRTKDAIDDLVRQGCSRREAAERYLNHLVQSGMDRAKGWRLIEASLAQDTTSTSGEHASDSDDDTEDSDDPSESDSEDAGNTRS